MSESPPTQPIMVPFPDPLSDTALKVTFSPALVSRDGAGTPVVDVPPGQWMHCALTARHEVGMTFLDWLSAVDEPDADPAGVDVVLHVMAPRALRTRGMERMLLRTRVPDGGALPSLTGVWPGVAWHERETFEMFGVRFTGFEDGTGLGLRPLLLPDGFEGTPLRKSFVLAARASKPWPGAKDPGDGAERPGHPGGKAPARRKTLPPGVPDPSWGPREVGDEVEELVDAAPSVRRAPSPPAVVEKPVAVEPPAVVEPPVEKPAEPRVIDVQSLPAFEPPAPSEPAAPSEPPAPVGPPPTVSTIVDTPPEEPTAPVEAEAESDVEAPVAARARDVLPPTPPTPVTSEIPIIVPPDDEATDEPESADGPEERS